MPTTGLQSAHAASTACSSRAPAALPGLGFLFVLSQTEEAVAEFGNQPCHPPWKRPWMVVPADVQPAPACGFAESLLQLPHPEELAAVPPAISFDVNQIRAGPI